MKCPSLQSLAAWVSGDIAADEEQGLEDHLFECDRCATRAEGLELIVRKLGQMLPPLLTPERRRRLEQSVHPKLVPIAAGERRTLAFEAGTRVGLWIMRANLQGIERLDCELLAADGTVLVKLEDVPFDTERGELVLGCQSHYGQLGYPNEMVARVTSVDAAGRHPVGEYFLNHAFPGV